PERGGGRDRGRAGDARLQEVVDEVRRIEPEQSFTPLTDRMRVEDPVSASHDDLVPWRVRKPDARCDVVTIGMDQRPLEDAAVLGKDHCASPGLEIRELVVLL